MLCITSTRQTAPAEVINARLWGGLHYRRSSEVGVHLGRRSRTTASTRRSNRPTDSREGEERPCWPRLALGKRTSAGRHGHPVTVDRLGLPRPFEHESEHLLARLVRSEAEHLRARGAGSTVPDRAEPTRSPRARCPRGASRVPRCSRPTDCRAAGSRTPLRRRHATLSDDIRPHPVTRTTCGRAPSPSPRRSSRAGPLPTS